MTQPPDDYFIHDKLKKLEGAIRQEVIGQIGASSSGVTVAEGQTVVQPVRCVDAGCFWYRTDLCVSRKVDFGILKFGSHSQSRVRVSCRIISDS
jgi:hypothetical protein